MIKVNPRCKKFIFFHGDLSPGNVFVEAKGNGSKACLTQIIDFEVSGFYPSWYPLINFRDRDYLLDTEEDWDSDYADGLVRYIRQFPNDFPDESEWKKARAATDNGFAKIRARQEIDDKEYEDEQLQKGKNKVKEAGIDEVASKLNALKPWWEWE
jgi:thiamine kinase-like enzyme